MRHIAILVLGMVLFGGTVAAKVTRLTVTEPWAVVKGERETRIYKVAEKDSVCYVAYTHYSAGNYAADLDCVK